MAITLNEISRTTVLWVLKDNFGKNKERELLALQDCCSYVGIVSTIKKDKIVAKQKIYQPLVNDLIKEITGVHYDDTDGINDEIDEISSILSNFKLKCIKERAKNIYSKV